MDSHHTPPREPILHVDMDAFYAAVEARDDPRLAGRPVVVGGTGGRGVVASASYEARAFGVTSAMPMAQALRRCPSAAVVEPRFDVYRAVSAKLNAILHRVTPLVEPLALDEAFLDVGGSVRLLGPPVDIARHLRTQIAGELGLPASVGIAPNKFLAKVCSRRAKPDGLFHLAADDVDAFLAGLAVGDLWGVGRRTAERLAGVGIRTVADLRAIDTAALSRVVGPAAARNLSALARGHDDRDVQPEVASKGLSAEQTFPADLVDPAQVRRVLLALSDRVAHRLRRGGLRARTITLKVRDGGFTTRTRSRTLAVATAETALVHEVVTDLLRGVWSAPTPVRLLGVGATQLLAAEEGAQLDLLATSRSDDTDRVVDQVREQFGATAITRAALLGRPRPVNRAPSRDDLRATGDR